MEPTTWIVITIIVFASVVKAFLLNRHERNSWIAYSRGGAGYLSPFEGAVGIFGALVGGFIVFGLLQIGFEGGLTGYVFGVAYLIGEPFLLLFARKAQERGVMGKGLLSVDYVLRQQFGTTTERLFLFTTCVLFA